MPKTSKPTHAVTTNLPLDVYETLQAQAERLTIPVSAVVRIALREWADKYKAAKKSPNPTGSVLP